MSERTGYSGGQLVAAFLGGAAAGAAVALLSAPKSGRESREQIRGYLRERGDEAARVPKAFRAARGAAKDAFSESIHQSP